jgi:hypothetical protein
MKIKLGFKTSAFIFVALFLVLVFVANYLEEIQYLTNETLLPLIVGLSVLLSVSLARLVPQKTLRRLLLSRITFGLIATISAIGFSLVIYFALNFSL